MPSFSRSLPLLLLLCVCPMVALCSGETPLAEYGVQRLTPELPELLGRSYEIAGVAVDWTHPLLKAEILTEVDDESQSPRRLDRWVLNREPGVFIQLAEPIEQEGLWGLPFVVCEEDAASEATPVEGLSISQSRGWPQWQPAETAPSVPEFAPGAGVPAIGVRWSGPLAALGQAPALEFRGQLVLSVTRRGEGMSWFFQVARVSTGPGSLTDLHEWLRNFGQADDVIAIHALGEDAVIFDNLGWVAASTPAAQHILRVGSVLSLGALAEGEPVDWGRMEGAQAQASSFEYRQWPRLVQSGVHAAVPFAPNAWVSREVDERDEAPWVEVDLGTARPVGWLRLGWPSSAGWSGQFDPAHVRLLRRQPGSKRWELLEDWQTPGWEHGEESWLPLDAEEPLAAIRVEFPAPSGIAPDRRARLGTLELYGPWDGRAKVQKIQ